MLPGPSSTQLSIYCAWRLGGWRGALIGGAGFILPGLAVIIALAAVFLAASPPDWIRGAGAGAGAAVTAVALKAGWDLLGPSWNRSRDRLRWCGYALAAGLAAALAGPWVVVVLLVCGVIEIAARTLRAIDVTVLAAAGTGVGGFGALAWTALKVGALSYGGGFVIIPLMRADAVDQHHWMSAAQFLNAVALGQVTPGPVVHTVAAGGVGRALAAAAIAFAPSFAFVLIGARHFERFRADPRVRASLDGAGPAAIGAILGTTIPLAEALGKGWQYAVLAGAMVFLFVLRRGVVTTLVTAGAIGAILGLAGAPLP